MLGKEFLNAVPTNLENEECIWLFVIEIFIISSGDTGREGGSRRARARDSDEEEGEEKGNENKAKKSKLGSWGRMGMNWNGQGPWRQFGQ